VTRARILLTLLAVGVVLWLIPPLYQDESYHHFADQRTLLAIPNFWNVVSNLPFAIVGILGWILLRNPVSRILFSGVFLTAFGSGYYHWAPDDARLVWDPLPMTIVFMTLFAVIIEERLHYRLKALLPLLLVCGIASVLWWRFTGNLWPYVLVQFVPMLAIPVLLVIRPGSLALVPVIVCYGLAKIAEQFDAAIYSVLTLSGHTWKHVLGALATLFILRWRRYC
jgi:hypothetical protein